MQTNLENHNEGMENLSFKDELKNLKKEVMGDEKKGKLVIEKKESNGLTKEQKKALYEACEKKVVDLYGNLNEISKEGFEEDETTEKLIEGIKEMCDPNTTIKIAEKNVESGKFVINARKVKTLKMDEFLNSVKFGIINIKDLDLSVVGFKKGEFIAKDFGDDENVVYDRKINSLNFVPKGEGFEGQEPYLYGLEDIDGID